MCHHNSIAFISALFIGKRCRNTAPTALIYSYHRSSDNYQYGSAARGVLIALASYWSEAIRPRTRMGRLIVPVLLVKLAALVLIKVLFFGPATRTAVDAQAIDAAVFHLPPVSSRELSP